MVFSPFGLALEGCCPRQVDTRPGLADCLWEKGCPSTTAKTVSSMVQQNPQRVRPYHGAGFGGSRNAGASNTSAAARSGASCAAQSGAPAANELLIKIAFLRSKPNQIAAHPMGRVVAPLVTEK